MSKERELLQAMKESLGAASDQVQSTGEQVLGSGDAGSGFDILGVIDTFDAVASSLAADPTFYLKALGILVLTVLIIMLAFQLISCS